MAGHRLVHHQVVHHVPVVLAVERGDPVGGPVRRRRRNRDERRQRGGLERPRRVAVGDRDAPVDLRHVDQLDRVVVDRDQVVVADEGRLRGQRLGAEGEDGRLVGGGRAEPAEDLARRPPRPAATRVISSVTRSRSASARARIASASAAACRVSESLRENSSGPSRGSAKPSSRRPAEPGAPRGELGEPGGEPVAVRRQRVERGGPRLVDLRCRRVAAPTASVRRVRDQRDRPVELGDRGLQVNLRHPPEAGAGRRQRVRHPRQPAGQRAQPLRQRRVVPRQQHVERRAGVGEERVPGLLAQLLDLEQAARHVARHQRGVDPQLRLEGRPVQVGQPGGEGVESAPLVRQRRLRPVRQQLVEPVIAQLGGDVRVPPGQVVNVLVGQPAQLAAAAATCPAGSGTVSALNARSSAKRG